MHYEIYNAAGEDPVILLHGGLGSTLNWGFQVPALMKNHKVIAADSRHKVNPNRDFSPFHDPDAGLVLPKRGEDEDHPAFIERTRRAHNEARCLWYVALTRARRRLVITAANDAQLADGRYPVVKTLFEELWNSLADDPAPGVVLALPP